LKINIIEDFSVLSVFSMR